LYAKWTSQLLLCHDLNLVLLIIQLWP